MAQYPCERCGQRYRGPQQTVYPALVRGTESVRNKQRLCPADFAALHDWCLEHLGDSNDPNVGPDCAFCGADHAAWAMYATVYATGAERADFYARVCGACLPRAEEAFFGTVGIAQPIS